MSTLRLVLAAAGAVSVCAAAMPSLAADRSATVDAVVAADRLIDSKVSRRSPWAGDLAGNAWWRQLARCTGFFIASADGFQGAGEREAAAEARGRALQFQREAIRRVSEDRGVGDAAALEVIRPHVGQGIGLGDQTWRSHRQATAAWNRYRSQCLDLGEIHASLR
ncbi:MAG TPA: hypothetical protein VF699_09190 [Caulobacteraceae bacterium]|jgi:hypothetical protein